MNDNNNSVYLHTCCYYCHSLNFVTINHCVYTVSSRFLGKGDNYSMTPDPFLSSVGTRPFAQAKGLVPRLLPLYAKGAG